MEEIFAAFASSYALKAWEPGRVDCCLCLADWAVWLGRSDPAAHLRGTYDSDEGFNRLIDEAGGVVPLVGYCVSIIGGKRLQRPVCGAVGVIGSAINVRRQFGAIYDGERWLVRLSSSFSPMSARPLAIWSI